MWDLITAIKRAEQFNLEKYLEDVSEVSTQHIRMLLRAPEVLPCAFDRTMEFWLARIGLWGRLIIDYYPPDSRRRERITKNRLIGILTDPTLLNTFGRWNTKKLSIKSVELSRRYKGYDRKDKTERIVIDIDLKPDLVRAIKGEF